MWEMPGRSHTFSAPCARPSLLDSLPVAVLQNVETNDRWELTATHLIGRSRVCQLQLDIEQVSSIHADLSWNGRGWQVQDRGSKNGTYVDGRRLGPSERAPIVVHTELAFGNASDRYRLIDDSPPRLIASSEAGAVCIAEDEVLSLPSADSCEVTVYRDTNTCWMIETDAELRLAKDQELVVAGGVAWRLFLPVLHAETGDAKVEQVLEATLEQFELELLVSRDGEHMEMALRRGEQRQELPGRAHDFMLLALAEARLSDASQLELPDREHGWLYSDELVNMLAIEPDLINLWVYRCRRQFSALELRGAARIIERRPATKQLRIGMAKLVVKRA